MLLSNTRLYNWVGSTILQTLVLMTGVVVNGKLYHLYTCICILLHYNSALLLTVDLIYTSKSFYCFVH